MQIIEEEAGQYRDRVYSPMVTLALFIEQVLSADQSCQDAVARALSARVAQGQVPSSLNTGPYCKARARLPFGLLERMVQEVGRNLCAEQPVVWRWRNREVKLVDGTVVSMADTSDNQASFPQNHQQKAGLGFPLARVVAIISLRNWFKSEKGRRAWEGHVLRLPTLGPLLAQEATTTRGVCVCVTPILHLYDTYITPHLYYTYIARRGEPRRR